MNVFGKQGLIATGFFMAIMGGQGGATEAALIQGLPQSDTPYLQVASLQSNRTNTRREVMQADHATGVLQISALVGRSNFEEQWAFIPSADIWIEIGRGEVLSETDSAVELDFDYLKQIVTVYDAVHIVHFHPAGFYDKGRWAETMFAVGYSAAELVGDEIEMTGLALPSSADVAASVQLVELLLVDNPTLDLRFSVVSPHGQVRYGATPAGTAKIVRNIGNPRMSYVRELATGSAIRRSPNNIVRTIATMNNPTIGAVIAELCAQSSSDDYRISFEPLMPLRREYSN